MFTVAELAALVRGEVAGDDQIRLSGLAPVSHARAQDLTFAENPAYLAAAEQCPAPVLLVPPGTRSEKKTLICVRNVRLALARLLEQFHPEPVLPEVVHPSAVVARGAEVDATAYVGPGCIVEEHVKLGPKVVLLGNVYVGAHSVIGEGSRLFANVSIYPHTRIGSRVRIHAGTVIGSDGYGYVFDAGAHHKIPQVGHVIIEDDVEIGANVTVDRGALGPTVIGKGTKIDNLVQIAHNVVTGAHCLLVAQAGIAGSTRLGQYVTVAGQAGIAGHLTIGNQVTLAAKSGVMHDIPDGQKWMGAPAQPDKQTKRQMLALQQLPELLRRVRELERRLGDTNPPPPPRAA